MLPSASKLFLLASLGSLIGCATPDDGDGDECADGKCDVAKTPCDGIMIDKSGNKMKNPARSVDDPLAKAVFHAGDTCPTTFSEIMDKLRENDKEGCAEERDGIETRVISETAQAQNKATNYRAVTTRTCNSRSTDGIVFSLFGLQAGTSALPEAVEMIAFDETEGVFNFYETDGNVLNFFGSSKDMLKGTGQGGDRRCAGCHGEGGLVMKELDTPWLHWEGHKDTPGADALIKKHKNLGTQTSGAELEGVVKSGNEKWNKTRIATLKAAGKVDELLRPLFCSKEFNLDNGSDFESPVKGGPGGDELSQIPFDVMLDPQLKSFGSISVTFTDYDTQIKANGQKLNGIPGAIDTVFDYVFPERAHITNDYIDQLVAARIIDAAFVKDVLMVDFTRPVFSEDRCALIDFAPTKLAVADLKTTKIRQGFIDALTAEAPVAGSPAAVLLKNLKTSGDTDDHDKKVDDFVAACTALGSPAFLQNQLTVTSLIRDMARESPIMEFEQTMPDDTLEVDRGTRLDPKTCQLTTSFVAP